jgi:hypothetical protein
MSEERTKAALHRVIHKAQAENKPLGSVRLNKIVFCADVEAFDRRLEYITEGKYIKRPNGPAIDGFPFLIVEMKKDGLISEEIKETSAFDIREYTSIREPDVSLFTAEEIELLDRFTLEICNEPAEAAKDKTHNHIWDIGEMDEPLPVAGYFKTEVLPFTDADVEKMSKLLAAHSK